MEGCACQRRGMRPIWTDTEYDGSCRRCSEYPSYDAPAKLDTIVEFKPDWTWRRDTDMQMLLGTTTLYAEGGREGSAEVRVMDHTGVRISVESRACMTLGEAREFAKILEIHIASAAQLAARYGEEVE